MLESSFDDLERVMFADCKHEAKLMDAIDCFGTTDLSLEPALDAWVAERPNSWAARVARAAYHDQVASLLRTTHWASEVTEEQWAGYQEHSDLAAVDLREVIRNRRATLPAYTLLLGTSEHHADPELLAQAIEIAPFTYNARRQYLWYLQPKWGGSMERMEGFVAAAAREAVWYPDLLWLADTLTQTRAEGPWRAGDLKAADRIFTEALAQHESGFILVKRASVRLGMKRLDDGMADLTAALSRSPCHQEALQQQAYLHAYFKRYAEAEAEYDLLLELDPLATETRFGASLLHFRSGNLDAVVRDLRIVTRYDPVNRNAWNNLGFALLELGRTAEAEEALTQAIDIDDKFVHTRYKRGKARYLLGKASAFEDLGAFVARKKEALGTPQEGGDTRARLAWAEEVLAAPRDGSFPHKDRAPK